MVVIINETGYRIDAAIHSREGGWYSRHVDAGQAGMVEIPAGSWHIYLATDRAGQQADMDLDRTFAAGNMYYLAAYRHDWDLH